MSEKLTIAVDMDDVVVETAEAIIAHTRENYDAPITINDFYSRDPDLWGAPDTKTAIARVNAFLDTKEYFESAPVQEAVHALRGLNRYHNLYIVTGRPDFTELATRNWLQQHLPDLFADVIFTNYFDDSKVRTKGDVCMELGADVLIDDHLDHCVSALESGVRPYLFGQYPWNATDELPDGITRVAHWPDVERMLLPDEGRS